VTALSAHAQLDGQEGPAASSAFDQLRTDRLNSVLVVITVMLVGLALVNAVFFTWPPCSTPGTCRHWRGPSA
jgi:hypothetical protein